MFAKVTIYDDNGNPKGAYELRPSHEFDCGSCMKYIFGFEYNQLKDGIQKNLRENTDDDK